MRIKILGLVLFTTIFASVGFSTHAMAISSNVDLYLIMETYQNKVEKAKADFFDAVKKINADARDSVKKGLLPMDEINAKTKTAMQDAKDTLRSAIQKAGEEARDSLYRLKASVDQSNQV